ncbi:MAG: YncE family protein [Geobacteraceae bacterium]
MNVKLFAATIILLLCTACQSQLALLKPALTEDGEVYLYSHPFPQEAGNLRFNIDGVYAVKADGAELPLAVTLAEFRESTLTRERLVASGALQPGLYRGFSFKAGKAFLKGEKGEEELVVKEKPEIIDFPFEVKRKKAEVFTLSFKFRESAVTAPGFRAVFSLSIPARPLTSLTGYATNYGANNITVFDKRSGEVLKVIETGKGPKSIVFDRNKLLAYTVISGEDAIEVIDLLSHEVINRIRLNTGDNPCEAALTPDGRNLLVVNEGSNTVSFIDPASNFESSRVNVGSKPGSIIIDPEGKRGYVFNALSSNFSVIDIAARTILATVTTESVPVRGDFSKRGDKLFVFHQWSPNLLVFDTSTLAVTKRIYTGIGVSFIMVDSATDRLYVAKKNSTMIDIYDAFSFIPMDFLKVADGASYMMVDGDENNLLLVLPEQNALQSINLVSKKERFLMDTGNAPYWSAIMGER